jgi:CheY-like chemotaxis protein
MVAQETGNILIADDEESFRLTTAEILRREGYDCDCVSTSEEALACLKKPYDLLIADINMPGNTDLEFLVEVHKNVPVLPIIVVTGYPSVPTAVEALHLAVVDYIVKPLKMPTFLISVAEGVKRGKLLRGVKETRQTVQKWGDTMAGLEQSLNSGGDTGPGSSAAWTMDWYLDQAVDNMAKLTGGLQRMLSEVRKRKGEKLDDNICALLECPRLTLYESTLRDTIDVLERTKRSFKSKELGMLRERIRKVLGESSESIKRVG